MASITSLNAKITFSIPDIFASGQLLQGFAADDIYDYDNLEVAETLMGVDGFLSAGLVKQAVVQNIALQADSPSCNIFDQLVAAQKSANDVIFCTCIVSLPSLKLQFAQGPGVLRSYTPISAGKRVLQPRRFTWVWQEVVPSRIT